MDNVKAFLNIVWGGRLAVSGSGRTFAKVPVWLAAIAALASVHLALVTALLIVAFGMKVHVEKV